MSKPKLTVIKRKIAVICPSRAAFQSWLDAERLTVADAVYYDDPERLKGITFSSLVLLDEVDIDPAYAKLIAMARSMVREDIAPPPAPAVQVSTAARPLYPLELRAEAAWMLRTNNNALVAHALLLQRVADSYEALEKANADLQAKLSKAEDYIRLADKVRHDLESTIAELHEVVPGP